MIKKIPFTQPGYNELIREKALIQKERLSAILELQRSRELGDLSENSAYRVARQKVSRIDKRIRQINNTLKYAYVVKPKNNGTIEIGSSFTINQSNTNQTYTLVSTFEADIEKGYISIYSPIGKNVLGKKKGDIITVKTPKKPLTFIIVKIH